MGRLNNDEQFKFLISCIRWSNNGKVDFTEVSKECGIVSKGAAAKRYERMMKAHGIHQPSSTARDTAVPPMRYKGQEVVKTTSNKKRKVEDFHTNKAKTVVSSDDLKKVKNEPVEEQKTVKCETMAHEPHLWMPQSAAQITSSGDEAVFHEFIEANLFDPLANQELAGQFDGANDSDTGRADDEEIFDDPAMTG